MPWSGSLAATKVRTQNCHRFATRRPQATCCSNWICQHPNYPLSYTAYHVADTIKPSIEVLWGVLEGRVWTLNTTSTSLMIHEPHFRSSQYTVNDPNFMAHWVLIGTTIKQQYISYKAPTLWLIWSFQG